MCILSALFYMLFKCAQGKLEKSGNLKVVRENRKSQGKCVLAFGMPAITLFNDLSCLYDSICTVPQIGGSITCLENLKM